MCHSNCRKWSAARAPTLAFHVSGTRCNGFRWNKDAHRTKTFVKSACNRYRPICFGQEVNRRDSRCGVGLLCDHWWWHSDVEPRPRGEACDCLWPNCMSHLHPWNIKTGLSEKRCFFNKKLYIILTCPYKFLNLCLDVKLSLSCPWHLQTNNAVLE